MENMTSVCNDNQSLNEMIVSYREGNEEAFSAIYSACSKIAEGIFYNKLSEEQRSRLSFDDLFQDSIVKAWRNLDRFDEKKASFRTWFSTIFTNTFFDAEKASKIRMSADISEIDETQISTAPFWGFYKTKKCDEVTSLVERQNNIGSRTLEDEYIENEPRYEVNPLVKRQNNIGSGTLEDKYIENETLDEILECMDDALSDQQREAISMFYFDGMSIEEISKAQGCGINTVKSRLSQSRNKLKTRFEEVYHSCQK